MVGQTIKECVCNGEIDNERWADFICPICGNSIRIDMDDCEEYFPYGGELYHLDCIVDEMKRLAKEYIITHRYKEFIDWLDDTEPCDLFSDVVASSFMEDYFTYDDIDEWLQWYDEWEDKVEKII